MVSILAASNAVAAQDAPPTAEQPVAETTSTSTSTSPMPSPADVPKATPAPEPQNQRSARIVSVGVLNPVVAGIDEATSFVVTSALVSEIRKHQGLTVLSMGEVRALLDQESNRQLAGCSEESCLAEIAEALGFDEIIITNMSAIDDGHLLQLKRLDQQAAKAVKGVSRRVEANGGEGMLAAVGDIVDELYSDHPIRAGATKGVPQEVALRLNPPPISLGVWGALAGTSVGLLAVAALAAIGAAGLQSIAQESVNGSVTKEPVAGRDVVNTIAASTVMAWTAYIIGGTGFGLAGVTGALSLLTDWKGYGDAE